MMTQKEVEIGKILEEIYFALASYFHIEPKFEFRFAPNEMNDEKAGMIIYDEKIIVIDSHSTEEMYSTLMLVYHEFRHFWQYEFYSILIETWAKDIDFYIQYKDDYVCTPELDAEWFAKTLGSHNTTILLDYGMDFYRRLKKDIHRFDELQKEAQVLLRQAIFESEKNNQILFPKLFSKLNQFLPLSPLWKNFYQS